jgi:hypothetical protein
LVWNKVLLKNIISVSLPASLGTLSDAALDAIAANSGSPYTEDFHNVLDPLEPSEVDNSLRELASDALAPIARVLTGGSSPGALSIRQVAVALFGRPPIDPSASASATAEFRWLRSFESIRAG